jgi:hypothetical protein
MSDITPPINSYWRAACEIMWSWVGYQEDPRAFGRIVRAQNGWNDGSSYEVFG